MYYFEWAAKHICSTVSIYSAASISFHSKWHRESKQRPDEEYQAQCVIIYNMHKIGHKYRVQLTENLFVVSVTEHILIGQTYSNI